MDTDGAGWRTHEESGQLQTYVIADGCPRLSREGKSSSAGRPKIARVSPGGGSLVREQLLTIGRRGRGARERGLLFIVTWSWDAREWYPLFGHCRRRARERPVAFSRGQARGRARRHLVSAMNTDGAGWCTLAESCQLLTYVVVDGCPRLSREDKSSSAGRPEIARVGPGGGSLVRDQLLTIGRRCRYLRPAAVSCVPWVPEGL